MLKDLDNKTQKCFSCFAKFICQRACIRDIAKSKGSFIIFDDSYCDILRDSVDRILFLYYNLLKHKPEFFNTKIIREMDNV